MAYPLDTRRLTCYTVVMMTTPRRIPGHKLTMEWSGEYGEESSSTGYCTCGWSESASNQREIRRVEYRVHLESVHQKMMIDAMVTPEAAASGHDVQKHLFHPGPGTGDACYCGRSLYAPKQNQSPYGISGDCLLAAAKLMGFDERHLQIPVTALERRLGII